MKTNETNTPETLAAIIAEMKRENRPYGISPERLHYYADRIEAAAERERAIADAMREALVEILDRTNREKARDYDAALNGGILEIHDIANTALNQERSADALEKAPAPDLAAAIAAALDPAAIAAALAAPARNCDRPECATAEGAIAALRANPCANHDFCKEQLDCAECATRWLIAPAKNGGEK